MKKLSQAGHIVVFCLIYSFFTSFVLADEIAIRTIPSNQICSPEIHIQVTLPENQRSCAIEERMPTGLLPSNISHNGMWDPENRSIKWGLFNDHETIDLSYQVTGINASITLSGRISIDGINHLIAGDSDCSMNCMPEKEQLASPVFDPPGGSIVPVSLNITSDEPGAVIRYTLDGSLPNETSTLFTTSLNIDAHSVIRAATFKQDYLPGDAVTATYYEPSTTTILRTVFDSNTCTPGIKLSVTANDSIHSIAIIETISKGLYPEQISNNGVWDFDSRTIKWGLFHGNSSYEVSYHVRGLKGDYDLSGHASLSGAPVDINGTSIVTLSCDIQQVAQPKLEPRSGTPYPVTVEISCDTPDATIHYTLDNSLPDQQAPIYSTPLSITSATKIKAMAFKSEMIDSPLAVANYPEPTIEHISLSRIIDPSDGCSPDITITIEPIIFTRAIAIEEIIPMGLYPSNISHNGVWDDNARTIKWGLFLNNDPLKINYQLTGVAGSFRVNGEGSFDGHSISMDGDTAIYVNCMPELDAVANPIFEPSEDSTLPVEVLITCDTLDANIYYTTDGSLPDQNATLFSTALTINSKTVVRARAFKSGMQPSDVISMAYDKTPDEKPYDINRNFQFMNLCAASVSIELSPHQSVQSYAYEENLPIGVYPTDITENGIWLENDHIIRWGLFNDHQQKTLSYTINTPKGLNQLQGYVSYDGHMFKEELFTIESECGKPLDKIESITFSPVEGSQVPVTVSMQSETLGVTIYYTTDGQLPDQSSHLYENPVSINRASTIRAIAFKDGMEKSDVVTTYYNNPPAIKTINTSLSNDNSCRPHITINVAPSNITSTYAIESYLDEGIMPVNISHQGQWDAQTNTIRWGLLQETKTISYDIYGENGGYQITGKLSINGDSMPAHDPLSVNIDCHLVIEQGESILAVMDEDGVFNPPYISAIGPDPESLIWEIADAPSHGTVTVSGTGLSPEMNYQPEPDWYGSDYFNVKVSDNDGAMDFIRINVNVNAVNDPPVFELESTEVILNEDFDSPQMLTITMRPPPFGEEDQPIQYELIPEVIKVADIIVDDSKERLVITSKSDVNGSEMIHLIASDGQLSYTQSFLLKVTEINDPPFFTLTTNAIELIEDFSEPYRLSVASIHVPDNERDQGISYSIVPESVNWSNLQLDPDTGNITIQSIPDMNGSGQFTIIADDGADQHSKFSQTITLTVVPENDPPKFNLSNTQLTISEDFEDTQEILIMPSVVPDDEKNQVITYHLEPEPLFVNMQLNAEEGQILITSNKDQHGKQAVHIIASDGYENYSKTCLIEVLPVNDSPKFKLHTTTIESTEDFVSPVCVALTLLAQPLDERDQSISFSILPSSVSWATIRMNEHTGEVCFDSIADKNGQGHFVITANDHQVSNHTTEQSFSFHVKPVNDSPDFHLSENEVTLSEDFSFEKTLTVFPNAVPADETGQSVIYALEPASITFANISIHPLKGEIMVTSIPNANGSQSFTITADDRQAENNKAYQRLKLTVEAVNDPPEFTISKDELTPDEDFTGKLTIDIMPLPVPEDEKNQEVIYFLYPQAVNWADVQINNETLQVEISAIQNASGNKTFSIIASDGQSEFYKDFNLIVNPVNDPPIAIIDSVSEIDEGSILTLNGYQSYDVDNENLTYQWEQVSGISAIIDNKNSSIAYVQVPKITQAAEQLTFRLTVSDGNAIDKSLIEITIRDVVIAGDINDDGLVDILDLVVMLEIVSNFEISEDTIFKRDVDVNHNGRIDLGDVLYVFQMLGSL